jgi:hypothetical protein
MSNKQKHEEMENLVKRVNENYATKRLTAKTDLELLAKAVNHLRINEIELALLDDICLWYIEQNKITVK